MHNLELILMLAVGFSAALVFGYITHRLGWSPIVGYLLAGILVGPQTPGFVADRHLAEQLAEVGVILLMFGVGLHFHLEDLLAVKKVAIFGAVGQSIVATALGAVTSHAFGWSWAAGVVYGLALSVASTVVLVRVLSDFGTLHSPTGRIAIGWLVMEDIFTVFVLVLLPVLFGPSAGSGGASGVALAAGLAMLQLAGFAGLMLVVGPRVLPRLLTRIAETQSRELFTLSVLAIALGIAAASTFFFHISMALGAFLAGMVVGRSDFSARAAAEALPLRDAFAVMFFLSVGMLFDPGQALRSPGLIGATLAVILIGKPLAAFVITVALGYGPKVALGVSAALGQIGEFSFLLAALGTEIGVLPSEAMNPIVAGAILSITVNPAIYRSIPWMLRLMEGQGWLWRIVSAPASADMQTEELPASPASHRAVVVGYGPVGRTLVRLLVDRGIEPTVIEMNIDTVRRLQSEGIRAVYGDVNQHEVRMQAGIQSAASLILSSSGSVAAAEAIRGAREENPELHIATRADFLGEAEALRRAGADEVFSGEGEVAMAMTDSILRELGGTPEQLDEFRKQLRSRLFRTSGV